MRYVLIALLLVVSTANAEDWQQIAALDAEGGGVFIDIAGITEVKGLRRAWFKAVYTSDQPIPKEYLESVPANSRSFRSEVTLKYFNCPERTSATMRYFWRDADDDFAGYSYQALLAFRQAPPGTLDEKMLEAACNFTGEFATAEAAKLQLPGVDQARITRMMNPNDYYPTGSRRRKEQGAPVVRACVDPSGKLLRDPVVKKSSGFPDLDAAAIKFARDARYAPGMDGGTALAESCTNFKVLFTLKK